ncbi:MAG: hypothetical protein PHQ91_03245 [Thermoanaerobaculaceae bacterium]|nr:hypothetical protein [Thermoanaerobaculaceae bacterium]
MNARIHPLVALFLAVVAVPLLAQQGNPQNGEPQSQGQTAPAAVSANPAAEPAKPVQLEGTIVTLAADRLELQVEKAVAPSSQPTSGLEGQTVPFLVDATTEKPAELKAGDRVDLWFTQDGDQRRAVRVALAAAAGPSSSGATEPPAASVPPDTGAPATGQPAAQAPQPIAATAAAHSAGATAAATQVASAAPATTSPLKPAKSRPAKQAAAATKPKPAALASAVPQPAGSTVLPNPGTDVMKTPPPRGTTEPSMAPPEPQGSVDVVGSVGAPAAGAQARPEVRPESTAPLPFVALGGLAALAALVMLRFTLRGGHVELGIGTGKGGLR